jgi:hypothetical protein
MSDERLKRTKLLHYKVNEFRLEKAWKRFEEAGFKPILIKGWAAAQVYPEPSDRLFNDIDLMIEPRRYQEAVSFLGKEDKSGIDLHNCAKILDTLPFENLLARSRVIKCGKTDVRILCLEDHLRILCVHWLNDGGAKKDKLWDIYYAVENRPNDFDWERCLNAAGNTRRGWVICAIGLAHKYLGLNIEDTPIADEASKIPKWLIKAFEKECESVIELKPLYFCLHDKKELWNQIKKRIPPNPIQATVEMEGEFDDKSRFFYQIGDVFLRIKWSIGRFLLSRFKK